MGAGPAVRTGTSPTTDMALGFADLPLEILLGPIIEALPDLKSLLALAQVDRFHHDIILGPKDSHIRILPRGHGQQQQQHRGDGLTHARTGLEEFLDLFPMAKRNPEAWLLRTDHEIPSPVVVEPQMAWDRLLREAERFLRGCRGSEPLSLLHLGSRRYTDLFLAARPIIPASTIYECASYRIFLLQSPSYLIDFADVYQIYKLSVREKHPLFHIALITYLRHCHILPTSIREAMRNQTQDYIGRCRSWRLDHLCLFTYLLVEEAGIASPRRPCLEEEARWILQLDDPPANLSDIIYEVILRWSLYGRAFPDANSIVGLLFSGCLGITRQILARAFPPDIGPSMTHEDGTLQYTRFPSPLSFTCMDEIPHPEASQRYTLVVSQILDHLYEQ